MTSDGGVVVPTPNHRDRERALRGALARKRGDNDVLPLLARECETATSDYLEDPMGVIRQVGADYRVLGHRSSSLGTLGTKRACSAIPGLQARPVCSTWQGQVVPGKGMVDRAPPTGRAINVGRLRGAAVSLSVTSMQKMCGV